jgi:hypothetical protein
MLVRTGDRSPLWTEEEFAAELTEYAAELTPSRFSVCLVDSEDLDAIVIGWGLALPDRALIYLFRPDDEFGRPTFMTFTSIERMRRRVCHDDAVRLIWVDPEPLPETVGGAV